MTKGNEVTCRVCKSTQCFIHGTEEHYLEYPWDFSGVGTVHISLSDRSGMKQLTVRAEIKDLGWSSTGITKCSFFPVTWKSNYSTVRRTDWVQVSSSLVYILLLNEALEAL